MAQELLGLWVEVGGGGVYGRGEGEWRGWEERGVVAEVGCLRDGDGISRTHG